MQYDHSKHALDYILVNPELEKAEVVCTLEASTKCRLPRPFVYLAQVDKNVGHLCFIYNMLRLFLLSISNVLILD